MTEPKRAFRGVFIPLCVWLDDRLTAVEKIILTEIDSLDGEDGCYASNEYLADFCQCSKTKVSNAISKLRELGYITVESFNGRRRVLRSCLTNSVMQPYKKCEADLQNLQERILIESTSKEPKKERKRTSEPQESFDAIIAERTDNPELRTALGEFVRMRHRIKKPLTNYALQLRLNKLWQLGSTDEQRIAIVNQSIGACWQDFFELKTDDQSKDNNDEYRSYGGFGDELARYGRISRGEA